MNDGFNSRLSSLCPKTIEPLVFPPADNNSGIFVNEVVKVYSDGLAAMVGPLLTTSLKYPNHLERI